MFLRTETAGPVYLTTNSGITFADDQDNGLKMRLELRLQY